MGRSVTPLRGQFTCPKGGELAGGNQAVRRNDDGGIVGRRYRCWRDGRGFRRTQTALACGHRRLCGAIRRMGRHVHRSVRGILRVRFAAARLRRRLALVHRHRHRIDTFDETRRDGGGRGQGQHNNHGQEGRDDDMYHGTFQQKFFPNRVLPIMLQPFPHFCQSELAVHSMYSTGKPFQVTRPAAQIYVKFLCLLMVYLGVFGEWHMGVLRPPAVVLC